VENQAGFVPAGGIVFWLPAIACGTDEMGLKEREGIDD
jgi:hypothetical protein